eukprot:g7265.t1
MDSDRNLPFPQIPHDTLRCGLATLKDNIAPKHPVQVIQEQVPTIHLSILYPVFQDTFKKKCRLLRDLYGSALPARMQIERQILQRRGRMPPFSSSNFGSEIYFDEVGTFGMESCFAFDDFSERIPIDTHSQMEAQFSLSQFPSKRGIP